jgi:hypothetical protein
LPLNISTELAVPFVVDIDKARADFPDFEFVSALTPSEQKALSTSGEEQTTSA